MESKRKNVYIVIFVITTIIASCVAVYFGIMGNKEVNDLKAQVEDLKEEINNTNDENQENKNNNDEIKNEAKELLVNDEVKKEHNKLLNDNDNLAILQVIIANKYNTLNDTYNFENGGFDDSDMLSISAFVALKLR